MALIVEVVHAGETLRGLVRSWSATGSVDAVAIDEVPRWPGLRHGDLVAVDPTRTPMPVIRVVEPGRHGEAVRVHHGLADADRDVWVDGLADEGWAVRADPGGVLWLAPPVGTDPQRVLAPLPWIDEISALRPAP